MSREHSRNAHKFRLIENPCADNYVRQSALNFHPLGWNFDGRWPTLWLAHLSGVSLLTYPHTADPLNYS